MAIQTQNNVHEFFQKILVKNLFDLKNIMRLVDWNRGKPYVFRNSVLYELINSQMLFARKFNVDIDGVRI